MSDHDHDLARAFLEATRHELWRLKRLGEKAMAQVEDAQLHATLDPEANSIALLVKHLRGNMLSRWTDFLTTDGEKPWRNRDQEFEATAAPSRDELVAGWEEGWRCLFTALEALKPEDLARPITIRGEELSVVEAIQRQLSHYAGHVGQLIFLAKHLAGARWKSLSIPRGQSAKGALYKVPPERP
jgi:hypothetical protein